MVGRDKHGQWAVCDEKGLIGGLFISRDAAIHFAMFESDHVPGAVLYVPDTIIISLEPLFKMNRSAAPSVIPKRM
ncbi:hypothetical protein [Beijerinckia indica]|nr:hypothetical protein [Beijerinckia indica]